MKRLLLSCLLALMGIAAHAQSLDVNIAVDPTAGQKQISPLIYGINAYVYDSEWKQSSDWKVGLDNAPRDINIVSRRLGGNTMTSYNWENGFSNSGNDDNHSNNNFQSFMVVQRTAVPEPATLMLLGSGLTLPWISSRFRRSSRPRPRA